MDLIGIGSVFDFAGKVIDKIFPDANAANQAKLELFKAQQAGQLQELADEWEGAKAQLAVDQVEAASSSTFVAGWRPFIGWVCGVAFGYSFVVQPIVVFVLRASGHPIDTPAVDLNQMTPVLLGMLGLGAMRSYDKMKGTSPANHA
jgi:hypothetical protein